jgi:hypothetical protein
MISKTSLTHNLIKVVTAYESLQCTPVTIPIMSVVSAPSGYGKSTASSYLQSTYPAIYVHCKSYWSASEMLSDVLAQCNLESSSHPSLSLGKAIDFLRANNRTIIVDEAHRLLSQPKLLQALQDIHDLARTPVILVGIDLSERKFNRYPEIYRRITQWVELLPLDRADLRLLAEETCRVKLADDLLSHILTKTGCTGLASIALSQIDKFGDPDGGSLTLEGWEMYGQPLFGGSRVG